MAAKEFIDSYGVNLIIDNNKTNILLKTDNKNIEGDYYLKLYFSKDSLKELLKYLESVSNEIWKDFTPREANSITSDYEEYYDRKYDNNGYLKIKGNCLKIEGPFEDCPYMYKFNKRRMESFIYDLRGLVDNL
ncbi:hypothetical protein [Clostridium culturomicium]|uniref:hypothetical protein n=1 Tax=Clostridium culturomicium TaxID=1499683 RepID=UPI0006942F6B|nr:hypothetical protein [Clostridium culturomicium]